MEVTKKNFDKEIANLMASLPNAKFLAIDLEFTGLPKDQATSTDTPMEVYHKAISCCNYNNIIQLGITLFTESATQGAQFDAHSYCFYVFPDTYNGKVNQKISLDVSSIEFNRDSGGVDFAKWINEGVAYYNKKLQSQLRRSFDNDRQLEMNNAFGKDSELKEEKTPKPAPDTDTADATAEPYATPAAYENPIKIFDEKEALALKMQIEKFKKWAQTYEVGKQFEFVTSKGLYRQHFWNDIRNSFNSELANVIIEEKSADDFITVQFTMATAEEKQKYVNQLLLNLEKKFRAQLGLSNHWEAITETIAKQKIPVIFHQGMLDCMFIYSHFENWCPLNFGEFRKTFSKLFPVLFDTKNLSRFAGDEVFHLQGLYEWCAKKGGFDPAKKYPIANRDVQTHSTLAHNAGWDSYMTGVAFSELRQMLGDVKRFENQITLFKNKYYNMSFGDDDESYLDQNVYVLSMLDKKEEGNGKKGGERRGKGKASKGDSAGRDKLKAELNDLCNELGIEPKFTIERQLEPEVIGNNTYYFLSFDAKLTVPQWKCILDRLRQQFEVATLAEYQRMVYKNFEQIVYGHKS